MLQYIIDRELFTSVQVVFDFIVAAITLKWEEGLEVMLDLLERAFVLANVAQRTQFIYTLLILADRNLVTVVLKSDQIWSFVEWIYSAEFYYKNFSKISQTLPASIEDGLTFEGLIDLMVNCKEIKQAEKMHSIKKFESGNPVRHFKADSG